MLSVLILFLPIAQIASYAEVQYEYTTRKAWPEDVSKTVQGMGEQGWELVIQTKLGTISARREEYINDPIRPDGEERIHYELLFRRQVLDCTLSFKLGKSSSRAERKVWNWYLLGIGSGVLGTIVVLPLIDDVICQETAFLIYCGISAAPLIPASLYPKRDIDIDHPNNADAECFRDGYIRKSRSRNRIAVILGSITAYILVDTISALFYTW